MKIWYCSCSIVQPVMTAAAVAAKSLQSCPTLCNPRDSSPNRLLCPWDSPGKNTGVGCHFLLQCMKVKSENEVAQSCPTLRDPMDCSLPGSSVYGIPQARVLELVAIAFSTVMTTVPLILPLLFAYLKMQHFLAHIRNLVNMDGWMDGVMMPQPSRDSAMCNLIVLESWTPAELGNSSSPTSYTWMADCPSGVIVTYAGPALHRA